MVMSQWPTWVGEQTKVSTMTTYLLKPRVPGGTWIAIVLMAGGAVMTGWSLASGSTALRIAGCAVAGVGLLLLVMVIVSTRRQRVWVTFDDEGYTVEGPLGEFSGSWIDVTDVVLSRQGDKIALCHGPHRRTVIAHPARTSDDEFMSVREAIRVHLDGLGD